MAGVLTAETLDSALDVNGSSFRQAASAVGYKSKSTQVSSVHVALNLTPSLTASVITVDNLKIRGFKIPIDPHRHMMLGRCRHCATDPQHSDRCICQCQ